MYIEVCSCGADRTRSKWPSLEKFTRLVGASGWQCTIVGSGWGACFTVGACLGSKDDAPLKLCLNSKD